MLRGPLPQGACPLMTSADGVTMSTSGELAMTTGRTIRLNLGSGYHKRFGYVNVDYDASTKPDVLHNLWHFPWPFESDSVDEIYSSHYFEHIPHSVPNFLGDGFIQTLVECHRVLRVGGWLVIKTPYWNNRAWVEGDPTHTRAIRPQNFRYVSPTPGKYGLAAYVPGVALELESWRVTGWEPRANSRCRIRGLGLTTHLSDRSRIFKWLLRRPTEVTYTLRKVASPEPEGS